MAANCEVSTAVMTQVTATRANYALSAGHQRSQYGTLSVNEFVGTAVLLALEKLGQDHTFETEFRKRAAEFKAGSKLVA